MRHGEGVNAIDLTCDGLPDLFLPSVREPARLLKNLGSGRFSDITASAGLGARGGVGAAVGDLNGDGRPDLYLARGADPYVAPNLIYLQRPDGTFADASLLAGLSGKSSGLSVTLADFNGDGTLDAFLPGWGLDALYCNNGKAFFTEGGRKAGLAASARGWAALASDFDNDGRLDLFVSRGSYTSPRDNRLYRNRGDGTFEDVTARAGLAASPWGFGATSADFDGDGDFDLYVASYGGVGKLYRNEGKMRFTDVTTGSGLTAQKVVGVTSGQIDGDLLPEIVVAGFAGSVELYKNRGGMKFAKVESDSGLQPFNRNEGLALADLDDDGDLDLYVANVEGKNRLYQNQLDDPRYLKLRFPCAGPTALGSVARLSRNGTLLSTVELSGAAGMGQGPQEIIFRLPDDGPFDLTITLPNGRILEKKQVRPGISRLN